MGQNYLNWISFSKSFITTVLKAFGNMWHSEEEVVFKSLSKDKSTKVVVQKAEEELQMNSYALIGKRQ